MLTAAQLEALPETARHKRVRALPSLEEQYRAYRMQRIEDYKDQLSREDLMRLGDEAAQELQDAAGGQLVLTEVLVQETVDLQIAARLKLPTFKKWRAKILPLREAQRSPSRWNMAGTDPVALVLPRIEPQDQVLIVGAGAERAVYLLAAHDCQVQCLFGEAITADRLESTLASEALSGQCEAFVVTLGHWMPREIIGPFDLVVVDAGTVGGLAPDRQRALVTTSQRLTAPHGLHAIVSADPEIAAEAILHLYQDWQRIPPPGAPAAPRTNEPGLRGVLLSGPPVKPNGPAPVR